MAKVTVYECANKIGQAQELAPGRYSADALVLADNSISSISVPPGWKATLWSDSAYSGVSTIVTTDVANLGTLGMDNSVSSLTVTAPRDESQEESTGSLGFLNITGANTYVNLWPLTLDFGPNTRGFTFEAWVWFDSSGSYARIFDFFQTVAVDNLILFREASSNNLAFHVYKAGVAKSLSAKGVIENGQWMHVAVTLDAAGYGRIYCKGALVAEGALHLPDNITRSSAWLGRSSWAQDAYFAGQMAEVRIWSVARSADEIKRCMSTRLTGTEAGLLRYFRMDEKASAAGVLQDLSGHNPAAVGGTAVYSLAGPKLAAAADAPGGLSFDGINDYLTLPAVTADLSSGFTLEAWVYFDSVTNWARIFELGNGPGSDNIVLARVGTTNNLNLSVLRGGTSEYLDAVGALTTGRWQHFAATLDAPGADGRGVATIYVNGAVWSSGRIAVPNNLVRTVCYIGKSAWSTDALFHGRMAEVRIWNRVRSTEQIQSSFYQRLDPKEPGLYAYYPLDERSSTVAHDVSPSGLDATLQSGVLWNRPLPASFSPLAPPQTALLFNGTDTYVQLPTLNADFSSGMTLEAWVYADTATNWGRILELATNTGTERIVLYRSGTSNHLGFSLCRGTDAETVFAADVFRTGCWLHVAVTQDSPGSDGKAAVTLYVNGSVCASWRMLPPLNVARTQCYVGKSLYAGDALHKGRMAELRIWTRARTQTELRQAMNRTLAGSEAGLHLYYPLSETGGQVASAQLVASATSALPWPVAMTTVFNGIDTYVPLPTMTADFSRGFTLEAWVYCDTAGQYTRIIELGTGPGVDTIILARVGTSNDLGLWVTRGTAAENIVAVGGLQTGCWLHVAATLDAPGSDGRGAAAIYVNGVLQGSGRLSLPRNLPRNVCNLGKSPWAVDPLFKGRMAEVRVWTRARTQAELQASMSRTLSGTEAGLCLYRPLAAKQTATIYGKATRLLAEAPVTTAGALGFDGVDDAVQLATLDADLSSGFSLETWLYLDDLGAASACILDLALTTGSDRLALCCEGPSGTLLLHLVNSSGAVSQCRAVGVLKANQWLHVAATLSSVASGVGTVTLLVNGSAVTATGNLGFPAPRKVARDGAWLGRASSGSDGRLRGRLCDVRVFARARTIDEIKASLTTPIQGQESGLVRHYPLDECVGTLARDQAQQDGTLVGAAAWEALPHARSLAFDGVDTQIPLPNVSANFAQGFTIEAWVMFRGRDYSTAIIDLGSGTGIDNILLASETTTNNLRLYTFAASMGFIEAANVIQDNVWMHVAATMGSLMPDGTGLATLYINGVAKAQGRIPTPRNVTRTASYIGKCNWPAYRLFRGRMSEVRLWTLCRSAADIATMMYRAPVSTLPGLCRYWQLNEDSGNTALDIVSNTYFTISGKPHDGLAFNGRTDYVQLPTLISSTQRAYTLEAKVWFAGNEFWARIFDLGNGQAVDSIILARNGTSSTLALVVYAASGIGQLNAPNVIVNGQWLHIAATFDGVSTARIYVNGSLVASGVMPPANAVDRTLCFVGKSNWASDPLFRGGMREVRIFDVERTQAEIVATKDTTLSGSERGLRYYFRLGMQASWREQNAAYPNDFWRQYREAKIFGTAADTQSLLPDARALRLDGRSGMVDLPGQSLDLSQGLTLEAWVCFNGTPKDHETLVAFGGGALGTSVLLWRDHTADRLVLTVGRVPSGDSFRFAQPRTTGSWQHIAATVDAARQVQIYVNGNLFVTGTLDANDKRPVPSELRSRFGIGIDGNLPFQGRMTEVRLWNLVRSGPDVYTNRSRRLIGSEGGLIRYYPLIDEMGAVARDWRPHPSATIVGEPSRWSRRLPGPSAAVAGGLEFNGTTTYVALPPIRADFSSGITLEAWVYFDGVQKSARIIELGRGELADNISLGRYEETGALMLQVLLGDQAQTVMTQSVIVDKTWMHIAATVPRGFGPTKIYINGVLVPIASSTGGSGGYLFAPCAGGPRSKSYLGKSSRDLPHFKGRMAEVRLWRRQRSAAEIAGSMACSLSVEDPMLVAYYRLDEVDGTRVHDASSARLDAEVRGTRPVWGARGPYLLPPPTALGALSFSGRSDWVELPAMTADFSTGFTIEAWVNFGGSEAWARILELANAWNVDSIILARDAANNNVGLTVKGSSTASYLIASAVIQNGKWMHIAATFGGVVGGVGQATIYIDGQVKAQGSCVAPAKVTRNIAYLGKSTASWDPLFVGRLAELRIWNLSRSAAEINRCKNARLSGSEDGLVAYYRLNDGDGERAGDASKNRLHGAVRGAAAWSQNAPLPAVRPDGGLANVLRLDAATWVSLPPLAPPATQTVPSGLAIEAWVWCSDVAKSGHLVALGNGTVSDGLYLGHSGSSLVFGLQVGTQPIQVVTVSSVFVSRQWIHIAASVDENGHVVLCKDGQAVAADKNSVAAPNLQARSHAQIGRSLSGTLFDGYLAEVRIWTTPRTPAQVQAARQTALGGAIAGLARCYPMQSTRGFTASDTSPQRKDGAVWGTRAPLWDGALPPLIAATPSTPAAVTPGALRFDGTSTYVRLPACSVELSSGFTFEATVRADGVAPVGAILDVGNGSAGDNIQVLVREDRRLVARIYSGPSTYSEVVSSEPFLVAGSWTQFSITVDSQRAVKLYQSGTSWAVTVDGAAGSTLPVGRMPRAGLTRAVCFLGKSSSPTQRTFQGAMMEVRLWSRARTAAEVGTSWAKQLSGAEAGLIALYRLNEKDGRVARGAAPSLGDGVVCGDVQWGIAAAPVVYAPAPVPQRLVPQSVLAPTGALPIVGWQNVDPATLTAATWSASVGVDSGDAAINAALTLCATSGLQFSLLGVSANVTISGSVSMRPLANQVALSVTPSIRIDNSYTVQLPQTVLTMTKGSSPMVYTLSFTPTAPLSLVDLVRSAAKDPLLASTFDAVLLPFLSLISDGTVLVASKDGSDPALGDYVQGMNLFVSKAMSELPVLNLIHAALPQLGLSSRRVVLAVGLRSTAGYKVSAGALLNIKLLDSGPVSLEFNELGIALSSAEAATSVGVNHRFTLTLLSETLVFRGGVSLEQTGGASAVTIWGALDPDQARGTTWKNPWGLPGLEIGGFGVQVRGGTALGIGCRGEIHIGDGLLGGTVALNLDTANPILLVDSPEGLDLPRLIAAFLPGVKDALAALTLVLAIRLKELKLYFAPQGGEIAGQSFERGISVGAALDLWGYRAKIFGRLDASTGAVLSGQADRIKIDVGGVTLLQFSDVSGNSGPNIDVALTLARQGVFFSGQLRLLGGIYQGYEELAVGSDGISFKGGTPLGALALTLNWQSGVFALTVAPRFVYSFEALGIPVNINVGGELFQRVDSAGFQQSLKFGFRVCGVGFDVGPVSWSVPLIDVKAIGEVFESFFGDQVKSFFIDTIAGGLKQAFEWVRDNLTSLAEEAIEIFKTAGAAVADIAKNIYATFDTTAHEVINFLGGTINEAAELLRDALSLAASEAAEVLGAAYGVGADAVKSAMSIAGYTAQEIASVASTVWDGINTFVGYLDPTNW